MRQVFLGCCLLLSSFLFKVQGKPVHLPAACHRLLDKRFPSWKYVEARAEIDRFLRERVTADARAEIVSGDWNGDTRLDYAVLIEHGETLNYQGKVIGKNVYLVAFLNKARGFRYNVLDVGTSDFLMLARKGSKAYDYETRKHFRYRNDAIFVGIFEKAGISYVYERKRFRGVTTSD